MSKEHKYNAIIDVFRRTVNYIKIDKLHGEFLNDFIWYMAFDLHYKWFQWRRCVCKITPFQFRDWILEKWQGRIK